MDMDINREMPRELLNKARRRHASVVVTSSVILIVLIASAWMGARSILLAGDELPPAGEQEGRPLGEEATLGWPADLSGWHKPQIDTLVGLWERTFVDGIEDKDPTPLAVRFSPKGRMDIDDSGLVDSLPAVYGRYELSGGKVSFVNRAADTCPGGDTWTWRVRLSEDGRMHIDHTESGTGNCYHPIGTEWLFTRATD
jgi:hypothetical protein